jgi:hypothetical protein
LGQGKGFKMSSRAIFDQRYKDVFMKLAHKFYGRSVLNDVKYINATGLPGKIVGRKRS